MKKKNQYYFHYSPKFKIVGLQLTLNFALSYINILLGGSPIHVVFFFFFYIIKCDIFIEICTFVSWIHKVPVPYPGLVNISKAHNI
jgi:hypothetical protein